MAKKKLTYIIWHDASKEHPSESGYYLCTTRHGFVSTMNHSSKWGAFNVADNDSYDEFKKFAIKVKAWAEVPKVEFEEENEKEKGNEKERG